MDIRIVTLFPEMVTSGAGYGICGRALARGVARLEVVNPREFATDTHRTVDDRPYGGGPGMVLKFGPFRDAIRAAREGLSAVSPVVFLSPQGQPFSQDLARDMTSWPGVILVAGRYEGFDQRLIEAEADMEVSIGDFVVSGGELAALVIVDAVVRLLPGALGDEASAETESFTGYLLDCPQYTRPEIVEGRTVPGVLLEGNHDAIRRWRLKQALGRTSLRRPDLLARRSLSPEEQTLLQEYLSEQGETLDGKKAVFQ